METDYFGSGFDSDQSKGATVVNECAKLKEE